MGFVFPLFVAGLISFGAFFGDTVVVVGKGEDERGSIWFLMV